MELLLLRCQCVRSLPLSSMSGRVLAQHTRALPGDTAWRRLTSPPANKLVTTRRALENKNNSCSQVVEPGASNNPPDPHQGLLFVVFVVEGTHGSFEPICLPFLN
eukprot:1140774-Pelagomonas_calceolata.AAC.2